MRVIAVWGNTMSISLTHYPDKLMPLDDDVPPRRQAVFGKNLRRSDTFQHQYASAYQLLSTNDHTRRTSAILTAESEVKADRAVQPCPTTGCRLVSLLNAVAWLCT